MLDRTKTIETLKSTRQYLDEHYGVHSMLLFGSLASAYVAAPQDTGHRPGIYLEFKEPDLNPENMEWRTYDNSQAPGSVPDANETLKRLGY